MAKTADVAFPVWTAIEDSVQLSGGDHMALYIGDKLSIDTVGNKYSIIVIFSPDVIAGATGRLFRFSPTVAGADYALAAGFRSIDVGGSPQGGTGGFIQGLELTTNELIDFQNDSITALPDGYTSEGIEFFEIDKPVHLCITTEIIATEAGPTVDRISEVKTSIYLDGQPVRTDINSPLLWTPSSGNCDYLVVSQEVKLGAIRIYDKILSPAQILADHNIASSPDTTALSDIEVVNVSDIRQPEFNGTFGELNELTFTTSNTGTYKILDRISNNSFDIDAVTNLPLAGTGTWGAYVAFEGAPTVTYAITAISVVAAGSAELEGADVTYTLEGTPGTAITQTRFNSKGVISTKAGQFPNVMNKLPSSFTANSITFFMVWASIDPPILKEAFPSIRINYPEVFDRKAEIPGHVLQPKMEFQNILDNTDYTVRVKGVSTEGKSSVWVETSTVVGDDTRKPNPVYYTALGGPDYVQLDFNFTLDLSGTEDLTFHTEDNVGYLDIVVCLDGISRDTSPGVPDWGSRTTYKVNLPSDATQSGNIRVQVPAPLTGEHFAWARLVSTSGVGSDWFPKDNGIGLERDLYANPSITRGIGPIQVESGTSSNLVEDADSVTTIVDTGIADPEGPGASIGAGGIFTSIP